MTVIKEIQNQLAWKCFDLKAILSLINQLRQNNLLNLLPEITNEYANIFSGVSKRNGMEEIWSKTEAKLKPHLENWNKCDLKSNRVFVA